LDLRASARTAFVVELLSESAQLPFEPRSLLALGFEHVASALRFVAGLLRFVAGPLRFVASLLLGREPALAAGGVVAQQQPRPGGQAAVLGVQPGS
jgi:hypothetical protein